MQDVMIELWLPFWGTVLGSACVCFMKRSSKRSLEWLLSGFAAGVMVAASIWSLLVPAMESAAEQGKNEAFPAVIGLWLGFLFLIGVDTAIDRLRMHSSMADTAEPGTRRRRMLLLAVTLHNLPEGMAVGAALAAYLAGEGGMGRAALFTLSLGIAIQNLPEGAIISLPLAEGGAKKGKAFWLGVLSGLVEPIGAFFTLLAAGFVLPILPYFLSFAAGAMLFVVVNELIPAMAETEKRRVGLLSFAFGFSFMMLLDVLLG